MILVCSPRQVGRPWGSLRDQSGGRIGEIWWLYESGGGSVELAEAGGSAGRFEGTLQAAREKGLIGRRIPFPLLVKTLHTEDILSVQVHPGAGGGPLSKAETWLFLQAVPGARVYAGLTGGAGRIDLERALRTGDPAAVLEAWDVRAGDAMHLPPGTVHALGGGIRVLEVQQNCDVTYRLYDWDRVGPDGSRRPLQVEEALACIDPEGGRPVLSRRGIPDLRGTGAGYTLNVAAPGSMVLGEDCALYMETGAVSAGGLELEAPCCLLGAAGGGVCRVGGEGYVACVRRN
jgi:mannose-6-phosphate isomerase class I